MNPSRAQTQLPLPSIRTITVGLGITPSLLTLHKTGARGLIGNAANSPPVGNLTLPWERYQNAFT